MTMTIPSFEEEEPFILDQVLSLRHQLKVTADEIRQLGFKKKQLEKSLEDAEQALIDYYLSLGVKQSECGDYSVVLGETEAVDVPDVEAVPEAFVRVKMVREPNKILIKELRPAGANWYAIKKNHKLTITNTKN